MKQNLLIIIFFVFHQVQSQEQKELNAFGISDEVKIDGAPKLYSNYFSEYYINENWNFRAEMQENTLVNSNGVYSVHDFPFLAKYKITNKWGVLFGPKVRLFKSNGNIENAALLSTFRMQFEVTESFSLEGGINLNITPNNSGNTNYNLEDNMIYKFGGRLKF